MFKTLITTWMVEHVDMLFAFQGWMEQMVVLAGPWTQLH